ncbi:MAG: Xaa-Pro peptidase family protein, partial [Planctomycetes bacterium]|nr:Xaa-Pro peptidase family protein [Planctomycetota bacterium]
MRKGGFSRRLAAFFKALDSLGLDGAVLDDPNDLRYFTGYAGSDAVAVFSAKKRRGWLVTDPRYREEAETSAPDLETVVWRGGFAAYVGGMLGKFRLRKTGYTPATLRVAFFEEMRAGMKQAAFWRDVGEDISRLRSIKDRSDVLAVEKALACAEAAFGAVKRNWKIGMDEIEIKNDLEWEMRRRGAEAPAFETIVAVGANASLPHARAGRGKVRPGKMLLVDFGARIGGYNSDLTRTLWPGEIPRVWRKRLEAVLAAQAAGIKAVRAGVPGTAPDAAARRVLSRYGLEEYFIHGLGHGVGLAIHENPRLGRQAAAALA